jgi:PAS domain S-box-containing protein
MKQQRKSGKTAGLHGVHQLAIGDFCDLACEVDEHFTLVSAGPEICDLLGCHPEDIVGIPFLEAISGESGAIPAPIDVAVRAGEPFSRIEHEVRHRNGSRIVMQTSGTPVVDGSGRLRGYRLVCRNVTVQKQAEEALAESQRRLATLMSNLPGMAYRCRNDSRYMMEFVSDGAEILTGYRPSELMDNTRIAYGDLIHPDDRDAVWKAVQASVAPRSPFRITYRIETANGSIRWVLEQGRGVYSADGDLLAFEGIVTDITEQKLAEEGIERRTRQLVIINEITRVAASSLSLAELMHTSLQKTIDLLGFDAGMIYLVDPEQKTARLNVYLGFPDWIVPESKVLDIHAQPYSPVYVGGQPHYTEHYHDVYPDREEFGILSFASIPLLAQAKVVGAMNIASRKHYCFTDDEKIILESIGREIGGAVLKEMLNQQVSDLGFKAKVYSKEVETANREANLYLDIMTHDINNANMTSLGYVDLLRDIQDPTLHDYVGKLERSVQKSIEIIRNVSTIRKLHRDTVALKPVDLDGVIRSEIAGHPDAQIGYEGTTAFVLADALLPEVFTNLIGNAVKFGGPEVGIAIRVAVADDTVVIAVEDTGPGIPDTLKPLIFNRFTRGSTMVRGMGLGLSITHMLMDRYGGRCWVEDRVKSHPDQGTVMKVQLRKASRGPEAA